MTRKKRRMHPNWYQKHERLLFVLLCVLLVTYIVVLLVLAARAHWSGP